MGLARGIQDPLIRCRHCGKQTRAGIGGVSIRSALFALEKAGVISEAELEKRDKSWKRYRAKHGLDRLGRPAGQRAGARVGTHSCS